MKSNRIEVGTDAVISSEEIKLILDQYRIGKKPLAKLLGWGETTIIRYMEGDVPTNEYSNKLKTILEDPEYYYDLLMKRKECLTGVAFKKSRNAVLSKIMATKIYATTYYIVNQCNAELCPSYIQYLLYYSQAFSLALYDRELFQEECGVNNEIIPYQKLYDGMRKSGVTALEGGEEFLNTEEIELINAVLDSFLWYGPKALAAMISHERTQMKISRDRFNNRIIAKDQIKGYFKQVMNQYQITDIHSIHKYPDKRIIDLKDMNL